MKSFQYLALTSLAALSLCHGASAQQVYRCGSSYSQTPCTGAMEINADDPRTEAQRAEARQTLASDKALAKDLEASRRKDEAAALAADKLALTRAAVEHTKLEKKAVHKKTSSAKPRTVKNRKAEVFTATDGAGHAKKKKTATKSAKP